MERSAIIAIDGPSGVGKSSVAKDLAKRLRGWQYLDTGAMYRAITLAWLQADKKDAFLHDIEWLGKIHLQIDGSRVLLNQHDVSNEIREREVTRNASQVAASPEVRRELTRMQQEIGANGSFIVDGRDIGTVVFPYAFLKVFLIASAQVRAKRRWLQLGGPDAGISVDELVEDIQRRDTLDSNRATAPLKAAEDAWHLDTDPLDQAAVTQRILQEAVERWPLLSDLIV